MDSGGELEVITACLVGFGLLFFLLLGDIVEMAENVYLTVKPVGF